MKIPFKELYLLEPKWQECYERYVGVDGNGETQRSLAAALGFPLRTIAWRCSKDGWQADREARRAAIESGDFASLAVATEAAEDSGSVSEIVPESVDDVLRRQQRVAQMLSVALEEDVERTIVTAVMSGKHLARGALLQLATVVNNIHALERKAHRLPDKIETKDTTPTADRHIDAIRRLKAEEEQRRAAVLKSQAATTMEEAGTGEHGPM